MSVLPAICSFIHRSLLFSWVCGIFFNQNLEFELFSPHSSAIESLSWAYCSYFRSVFTMTSLTRCMDQIVTPRPNRILTLSDSTAVFVSSLLTVCTTVYHHYSASNNTLIQRYDIIARSTAECASRCKNQGDCNAFSYTEADMSCSLAKSACVVPSQLTEIANRDSGGWISVYANITNNPPLIRNDLARGE